MNTSPFSGLAPLVLSSLELSPVHHYHKVHLEHLQCLHQAGSLPATGLLDLRKLCLLGMLARLGPGNILHQHAIHVLLNLDKQNVNKSWFSGIRTISTQYDLPDPFLVLQSPPFYSHWKNLTKCKVL